LLFKGIKTHSIPKPMKIIELIRIRTGSGNSNKLLETLQQITAEAMLGAPEGTV
jgi:hypothetical protein